MLSTCKDTNFWINLFFEWRGVEWPPRAAGQSDIRELCIFAVKLDDYAYSVVIFDVCIDFFPFCGSDLGGYVNRFCV